MGVQSDFAGHQDSRRVGKNQLTQIEPDRKTWYQWYLVFFSLIRRFADISATFPISITPQNNKSREQVWFENAASDCEQRYSYTQISSVKVSTYSPVDSICHKFTMYRMNNVTSAKRYIAAIIKWTVFTLSK